MSTKQKELYKTPTSEMVVMKLENVILTVSNRNDLEKDDEYNPFAG